MLNKYNTESTAQNIALNNSLHMTENGDSWTKLDKHLIVQGRGGNKSFLTYQLFDTVPCVFSYS